MFIVFRSVPTDRINRCEQNIKACFEKYVDLYKSCLRKGEGGRQGRIRKKSHTGTTDWKGNGKRMGQDKNKNI
jgi:hypothetical protein